MQEKQPMMFWATNDVSIQNLGVKSHNVQERSRTRFSLPLLPMWGVLSSLSPFRCTRPGRPKPSQNSIETHSLYHLSKVSPSFSCHLPLVFSVWSVSMALSACPVCSRMLQAAVSSQWFLLGLFFSWCCFYLSISTWILSEKEHVSSCIMNIIRL